jgi:UDP-2,3-diacylglucosamine hydrolase
VAFAPCINVIEHIKYIMKPVLFISDLHLAPERPAIIELFLKFMDDRASKVDELYILGDLVEYWLGDDDHAKGLEAVFNKIKHATDNGLKVYLMHGNRDFLMGEKLAKRCGLTLISDPYIADLNGSPALLMHGDTLCTDDVRYQELRLMLRNPEWQKDFLSKPLSEREMMAKALREKSSEETQAKDADIMDVNADAVKDTLNTHKINLLIHGHTHRPDIHHMDNGMTRVVLGDWYKSGSVLEFKENDKFYLKEFH